MKVLYFAWIRERIGKAGEDVSPPKDVTTPADLAAWLCAKGENYAAALKKRDGLKVAVNQVFASWDKPLKPGDEVAFFPPMTGG